MLTCKSEFSCLNSQKYGNDTSAWDKDVVMQAGKLISGLETEDIEKLTLDTDIIEVLGKSKIKEVGSKQFYDDFYKHSYTLRANMFHS